MRFRYSELAGLVLIASCAALPVLGEHTSAACGDRDDYAAGASATGGWRIHGGTVAWTEAERPQVSGSFEICPPRGSNTGDAAPLQGGACLVADLTPFGIGMAACETHADCNAPGAFDRLPNPGAAEYSGYCIAPDGSDEPPRCWTRPGPAGTYCRRSIDALPMTAGSHRIGPVSGDPLGTGKPFPQWAVYACLAHAGHDRACGEPASPHRQVSLTPRQ